MTVATISFRRVDYAYHHFGTVTAPGYSPEQQIIIEEEIDKVPTAPEGYLTLYTVAEKYDIKRSVLEHFLKSIQSELGEIKEFRLNGRPRHMLSPEQQLIVDSYYNK